MHQFARKASTAALAASRQGKFWEYSEKLFENPQGISDARIQEIAKELSLNMAKFNKDLSDPSIQALIERDIREGSESDVRGTPTVYVNGKMVKMRSFEDLIQMIDNEVKKKK